MSDFMRYFVFIILAGVLGACDQTATSHNLESAQKAISTDNNTDNPHDLQALAKELAQNHANDDAEIAAQPIITADGKTQIDWSFVDTKVSPADTKTYDYPIALDSQAVKNYANAYQISDRQAQHSIVVAMASPEALGKVLDQLTGKYLGHTLTDGADMSLVIHTTSDVVGERHDYVFADSFGKGLVLPIVIDPKSAQ